MKNSWGCRIQPGVVLRWDASDVYTDGSFFGEANGHGSAVVFPSGDFVKLRSAGHQGIYKAKVAALLMACGLAHPSSVIRTDNKGLIGALKGHNKMVTLGR